jgi:hypothetical protein
VHVRLAALRCIAAIALSAPAAILRSPWAALAAEECADALMGDAECSDDDTTEACASALAGLLRASRNARAAAAAADTAAVAKAHAQRLARAVTTTPEAAAALLTELRLCGAITPDEAAEAHALAAALPARHAAPHDSAADPLGPPWTV